jgi:hypothetical protein
MTWREVVLFANRLSRIRGLSPCYYTASGAGERVTRHNVSETSIICDHAADGFRLPTDRELVHLAMVAGNGMHDRLIPPDENGEWCWPSGDTTATAPGSGLAGTAAVMRAAGEASWQIAASQPDATHAFRLVRTVPRPAPRVSINRLSYGPDMEADLLFSSADPAGQPLEDLHQEDLRVALDGQEIPFNLERMSGMLPVNGIICLDMSASIPAADIDAGRRLVAELLRQSDPADRWSVMLIGGAESPEFPAVERRAWPPPDEQPPGGFTRLYDTLMNALDSLGPSRGARQVIVLTDGRDTHSRHIPADVVRLATERRIILHAVGLGDPPGPPFTSMIRATGGRLFPTPGNVSPHELMASLRHCPAGQYRIRGLAAGQLKGAAELRLSILRPFGLGEICLEIPPALAQRPPLAPRLPEKLEIPPSRRGILPVSVELPLDNLPEAWQVTAWEFQLEYDSQRIRVEDFWPAGTLSDGWNVRGVAGADRVSVRAEGPHPLAGRGPLVNITLTVRPEVGPGGGGLIRLTNFRINGIEMAGVAAVSRIVMAEDCIAGDVSGDGVVSVFDAQLIEENVIGEAGEQELLPCAADVTGDGRVTALDAAWIRRCDAGEWSEFPVLSTPRTPSGGRLRVAAEDIYPEREFVWRVPVMLESAVETMAWEMVFAGDENWSLGFEPSLLTDTCTRRVARRGDSWRVVMTGATPLRRGCLLYVEIRTDPVDGLTPVSTSAPRLDGLLRAYRIDEDPPHE